MDYDKYIAERTVELTPLSKQQLFDRVIELECAIKGARIVVEKSTDEELVRAFNIELYDLGV